MWKVFSNVVKLDKTVLLDGTRKSPKAMYRFHELIIDTLRPTLKEGVRSIILASPARTNYTEKLTEHIREHHAWLSKDPSMAFLHRINGSANSVSEVHALIRTPEFRHQTSETISEETENLVKLLEKHINASNEDVVILYSLEDIEAAVLDQTKLDLSRPKYFMLTDKYLENHPEKNRLQRLIQIAMNKNIKVRIVDAQSTAGQRLKQLGGLVFFWTH